MKSIEIKVESIKLKWRRDLVLRGHLTVKREKLDVKSTGFDKTFYIRRDGRKA